jgi:hypothetical protein
MFNILNEVLRFDPTCPIRWQDYATLERFNDNGGGHSEQKVKVGLDSPGNGVESRECLTYSLLHTCTYQDDIWTMSIDELVFEFLWSITFF